MITIRRALSCLVVLALVCSGLVIALPELGGNSRTMKANFRSSLGLYKGNSVNVLGYKVGTIKSIEPHGKYVQVTFSVADNVKVPADAKAVIIRPGVVTDRSLELTPVYRGGPVMRDGAVIALANTRQPVEFDDLFTSIDNLAVELTKTSADGTGVHEAIEGLAATLDGNGKKLKDAINGASGVAAVAADNSDVLVKLIHDLATLAATTKDNDALVRSFSDNLASVTDMMATDGAVINAAFAGMAKSLRDVAAFVADNRDLLKKDLDSLLVTTDTLAKRKRELAETIDVLPTTFENATRAIDPKEGALRVQLQLDETVLGTDMFRQLCLGVTGKVPVLCSLLAGVLQ